MTTIAVTASNPPLWRRLLDFNLLTGIVLAITFGYLVFGDAPNHWTLAGAAIVIGSGLYILRREYTLYRKRLTKTDV